MEDIATVRLHTESTNVRLRGSWLKILRVMWIAVAVAGISLYIATLPSYISTFKPDCQTQTCSPTDQEWVNTIQGSAIPLPLITTYFVIIDSVASLIAITVAILIFWRRSDDRVAMLSSFMLLVIGLTIGPEISTFIITTPVLLPVLIILQTLGWASLAVFFLIFPDGQFVPRWTRWTIPIWLVVIAFIFITGASNTYSNTLVYLVLVVSLVFGLWTQVYRYRHVSSPAQRQQTKWVMLAVGVMALCYSVGNFPTFIAPALRVNMTYRMIRVFMSAGLPFPLLSIALAFSMLRYRLWDVDFIINQTLVYGALTLLLGGIFVGGFFALRGLLGLALGNSQDLIAIAAPAVLITALFNPAQKALRRFVDKRFYGIKLDYLAAAKAYDEIKKEPVPQSDANPATFGGYSEMYLIGRGGMGEVYRAQHPTLNRSVAIKIMSAFTTDNPDAPKRFLREAQIVAKLKHPNIITLHDMGEQDGKPYMVMEYIDGKDLAEIIKESGRMPHDEALAILQDIANALDYAHTQGIIHRDIKPSNVMVEKITATGAGKTQRAVLMDFGIAKNYAAGTKLTQSGMIGTLDYISPEQIQGASEVDAHADIYSLGVMSYYMFTGTMPFVHNNPGAMVMAHLMQPPPDPRSTASDLSENLAYAIMRSMAKKPEDRFSRAGELVAAFGGNEMVGV